MKKIIFLLMAQLCCAYLTYGQIEEQGEPGDPREEPPRRECENCTEVLPLRNGDLSSFAGPTSITSFSCTTPDPGGMGPTGPMTWGYFSNTNLPNWYRINGSPNAGPGYLLMQTFHGGGGRWCQDVGTQGIAANYPFIKGGQYRVTLFWDDWRNHCTIPGNISVTADAMSGLTEPSVPSYYVDPVTVPAGSVPIGGWAPDTWTWGEDPVTFCSPIFTQDKDQLYLRANQAALEHYPTGHSYADEPAGFTGYLRAVSVELCNECPKKIYRISSPSSPDPVTAVAFSAGGLFIDAGIFIDGPTFANTPSVNTMLVARAIVAGESNTSGNAFTATANAGKYFLMVPNKNCEFPCGPIEGPETMPCLDFVQLTTSPPGGTWSSSNPGLATVNSTGGVSSGSNRFGGTVTITYTAGRCVLTKVITIEPCPGKDALGGGFVENTAQQGEAASSVKGNATQVTTRSNATRKSSQIRIYPVPANNVISYSYECPSVGALDVSIKDVSGRVRYTESMWCDDGKMLQNSIDITNLAPGVYYVELTHNGAHEVKKIVKL